MKRAADFRQIARDALIGRWGMAILAGLLAGLFGAVAYSLPEFSLDMPNLSDMESVETVFADDRLSTIFFSVFTVTMLFVVAVALIQATFASIIAVGYCQFNLDYVDRRETPSIGTLFRYFKGWKTIIAAYWLRELYVFLWSLLFIIPGIIAEYNYAMVFYILAENPELTAGEALEKSKAMMCGHRWRLFCLHWSFIGWDLLCALSMGVGNLWLVPYKQAAVAAFYRDISQTEVYDQPAL